MYPIYQFRVSDGHTCKILPVPAIDSRHAELRANGWCAGTAWHWWDGLIQIVRIPFRPQKLLRQMQGAH